MEYGRFIREVILRDDYLRPLGISVNGLGNALHIKPCCVNDIVREIRGVIPDTALRLTGYFGGDTLSWMNPQQAYDPKLRRRQF